MQLKQNIDFAFIPNLLHQNATRYDVWNQTQQLRLKTKCYKKYKMLLNWSQLSAVATQKIKKPGSVFENLFRLLKEHQFAFVLLSKSGAYV